MKASAKFFCESCGAEVAGNSKFCKKCGRFFASVRCPACGETGPNEKFKNGCPKCGYAVKNSASAEKSKSRQKKERARISRKVKNRFLSAIDSKSARSDGSLPTWSYCAIFIAFVAVAGVFFYMNR